MISPNDPRLLSPKFHGVLTFNSVHTARAAAKAFAESVPGAVVPMLTTVVMPSKAKLLFMRLRDEADARLLTDSKFQYIEFVEPPDVESSIDIMKTYLHSSDGIEAEILGS